ncbi:FabD/lysophospholipase-like protein [Lophium mytilinum]|uniref:FabD/lysophospholipase-like protein n=1 Tax=Lophium mytilinum TaxID=390894 RepID=A0A6A6QT15_9PEZI|nr:FabD/lysophospholipase-like protein [Lophium mytilinum]
MAMASSGIRRKDTTKGPPLRILSLDGGGVRGYSMLILLQELMHRTFVEVEGRAPKRHEIPKPCEHFDLIGGTGTGGLIAIMLGRLRMDIDTSKDVYVRMTKKVFETDKTFAGIPYRSTLFKASKLEEAIMECVREHTIYDDEGNDHDESSKVDLRTPMTPGSAYHVPRRSPSNASRYSQIGSTPLSHRIAAMKYGDPNALMYDTRENRTKTAVTAVYKGTPKKGNSVLLRSYDSRKEPAPEFNCTIWQAGRATSATGLAFKPIQIGQSVFIDEGAGKYNPAPQILDEAVCNEWPGREVGVFVSIGTGKRPSGSDGRQQEWWEGFVGSNMGNFAEARRRLISKIEGCEETHLAMKDHLAKRQVNPENYYRLNVNVGVGEFGMNEWGRLADISTNTRRYLSDPDVQSKNLDAAAKLGRIHRAKIRWERAQNGESYQPQQQGGQWDRPLPPAPSAFTYSEPMAVELPANEDVVPQSYDYQRPQSQLLSPSNYQHHPRRPSESEKIMITSADEFPTSDPRHSGELTIGYRRSNEQFTSEPHGSSAGSYRESPRRSGEEGRVSSETMPNTPPPRPPKTPIQHDIKPGIKPGMQGTLSRPPAGIALPYPDTDGPPPVVNMARKPEYGVR